MPDGKRAHVPSVQRLFLERITREGLRKEFMARVRAIQNKQPKRYGPSFWQAMREWGYTTAANEREQASLVVGNANSHAVPGANGVGGPNGGVQVAAKVIDS